MRRIIIPLPFAVGCQASAFPATAPPSPIGAPGTATLTWTSAASRLYYVEERTNLTFGAWATNLTLSVVSPDAGLTTTRALTDTAASNRFFRVQAVVPLLP